MLIFLDYQENIFLATPDRFKDIETILSLYPDVKGNTLIEKEIDIFVKNNDKIKELKEKRISRSTYNWLIYFGN